MSAEWRTSPNVVTVSWFSLAIAVLPNIWWFTIYQEYRGKSLRYVMRRLLKKLAWLSVEDYGATVMEIIVASAMKGYLRRMSEEEALKKVESIIEPKIIQLFGESGAPMPVINLPSQSTALKCRHTESFDSSILYSNSLKISTIFKSLSKRHRFHLSYFRLRYENWKWGKMICPESVLLFCRM